MNWKVVLASVACAAALLAQTPETVLLIETQNAVYYREDNPDPLQWSRSAGPVAAASLANFNHNLIMSDIVAVNGKPAKGTLVSQVQVVALRTAPTGSNGIADTSRNNISLIHLEILQANGTPVGTLAVGGPGGVSPALGAPSIGTVGAFAVYGGTGAFLGARGQAITISQTLRSASILENPINRRTYGGGTWKLIVQLVPMTRPEVFMPATGPALYHSEDWSPVSAAKPARAGEWVIMAVSGLGPTKPSVDPGKPFPGYDDPPCLVNSPVEVTVNGKPTQTANSIGWPETQGIYRTDFLVPADITPGTATVSLSVAWINGPEVQIPVR